MCSISGFITKKSLKGDTAKLLTNALLFYGAERGDQSAGVLVNNEKLLKRALPTDRFRALPEYKELFKEPVTSALIHTRMPTCGGVGDEQAQPFKTGQTATIHNGWINETDKVMDKWNIKKKSGVDSQLITSFINSYGIRKLTSFIRSSSGSSAIAVMHYDELYLFRSGNPIWFTFIDTQDDDTLFVFASTEEILGNALRYVFLLEPSHPMKQLKEGVLFHINTARIAKMSGKAEHKNPWSSFGRYHRRWDGHWWDQEDYIKNNKGIIIGGNSSTTVGDGFYDPSEEKREDIRYFSPNKEGISTD